MIIIILLAKTCSYCEDVAPQLLFKLGPKGDKVLLKQGGEMGK